MSNHYIVHPKRTIVMSTLIEILKKILLKKEAQILIRETDIKN